MEAHIKHEEIKGFMSAMTMPYRVKDAKEFANVVPGDLINARLIVLTREAYLESVRKVGNAPVELPPASAASAVGVIPAGHVVPNISLVDQDGRAFTLEDFRGSAVVATFTYLGCPMPDMCPLMDHNFAEMQRRLKEQQNPLRVRLLSVTIDPDKDTPAALNTYAKTLDLDPKVWTFATGNRAAIDRWALGFGVSIARAADDPSSLTHNLRTVILDRQGNLVQSYTGNKWTPVQVLADVRAMVGVD